MHFRLSNGQKIPAIGLGTWRSIKDEAYKSVRHALEVGYRHIDTAAIYGNEVEVGKALADSGVPREDVFLTSKLWNTHWTTDKARGALKRTLENLGTDYLDLYLIHWPGPYERIRAVWIAMEEAVDAGTVRSIGVSNFSVHHVDHLLESARIAPVANQVECHPHLQNVFLNNHCNDHGLVLEAYAPLNSNHIGDLLGDSTLKTIAEAHGKTIPQVVLRWHIQRNVVPLPKSVTPSRIEENFQVFDFRLSPAEMKTIRRLNRAARHFEEPDNVDFGFRIE